MISPAADSRDDPDFKRAISRARWSVIQTGLITTGLALFGVYVLANRINDVKVMDLYVLRWIPAGAWIVGTVAGSGYAIASWWNGMRVRGSLLLAVLALQALAYFAAQYVQFESFDPPFVYRDTNEPISFSAYFHYTTLNLTPRNSDEDDSDDAHHLGTWGYAMRGVELSLFSLGAISAAVVLFGQAACPLCHGNTRRRRIATLPDDAAPATMKVLREHAAAGNVRAFAAIVSELQSRPESPLPGGIDVCLYRCTVCGNGLLCAQHDADRRPPTDATPLSRPLMEPFFAADGRPDSGRPAKGTVPPGARRGESAGATSRPSAPP